MISPNRETYLRDSGNYNLLPVSCEVNADFDTPLSIFLKVRGQFLLESIERGEHVGRFSMIALGSICRMRLQGKEITIDRRSPAGSHRETTRCENPLTKVREYFQDLRVPAYENLPPFFGGAIGYLGYECVQYFENVPVHENKDGVPDGMLVVPETILIYDSVRRIVTIVISTLPGKDAAVAYETACRQVVELQEQLARPLPAAETQEFPPIGTARAEMSAAAYIAAVQKSLRYIREGDIFQVVLSRRLEIPCPIPPFDIYQALRILNPSPYLFYLDFDDFCLVGSSPEVMVKVQNRELLLKPIAGTRTRGETLEVDNRLASELLADEKERAEHLMLVDLGRNDLGRIAKAGTVEVSDFMKIERYSHVMHIVSSIKAELDEKFDVFDVIAAVFPAGTLTGAPKIRAMEIIHELEPGRRGPYGGMIFYLGFNGNFDSGITIRTIVYRNGRAVLQAGAGIVADSIPEKELAETEAKAKALREALEKARERRQS